MRGLAVVIAIALVPAVAGCTSNGGSPSPTSSSSGGGIKIAYLDFTANGDFPAAIARGAASVVKPGGGSVTFFNANFDPQAQIKQCQDAITSGKYKAIILSPVDPATGVPCVQAAHAAGIPVANVETAVGTDPYDLKPQVPGIVSVSVTALQTQVDADKKLITQACAGKNPCQVIAEIASPTDRWTNDLTNAIEAQMKPKVQFVARLVSEYDPGAIAKGLPDLLNAHPDTAVFLGITDDTALAAVPVLASSGKSKQVKLIGLGGSIEGAKAVSDGTLFGTTGNWPFSTGAFLAKGLQQAVAGEKVTYVSVDLDKVKTPLVITKSNVASFKPEWGNAG